MATKSPTKLRTLLREVYSDLKKSGSDRITIHELVDGASKRSPKLVALEKDRLFRDAIGSWARQILRSDSESLRTSQLILPMDLGPVTLPVCIAVRHKGQKGGEAEWIETPDVTYAQLVADIEHRQEIIRANRQLQSLMRVREYLAPHMASHPNTKIGPVLARLAKQEKKEGESE